MAAMETLSRYRWVILGIACLAQLSNALSTQMVAPLAPLFQGELGLSKAEIGFFSSAIFLGWWVVVLIAGSVTDRIGVRWMLLLAEVATGVFLLAMTRVATFHQAVAVMFAAGIGSGALQPVTTKAIVEWFVPTVRATAMGLKGAFSALAGVLTAGFLPAMALALGWRTSMALVGAVTIVAGVVAASLYRDPFGGRQAPRARSGVRANLAEVAQNRHLWIPIAFAILLAAAQLSVITYLALYFSDVVLVPLMPDAAARAIAAGGFLAVCQAGGVFGRVFWGLASDRVFGGRRLTVLAIISALSALLAVWVSLVTPAYPVPLMGAIVFAYGATAIGWNGLYYTAIAELAGKKYAGTGIGLTLTFNQLGTVGGPPLIGLVVDVTGSYQAAWLALGGLAAVAAIGAAVSAREEDAHHEDAKDAKDH